jgi:hypothetical protein
VVLPLVFPPPLQAVLLFESDEKHGDAELDHLLRMVHRRLEDDSPQKEKSLDWAKRVLKEKRQD